MASVSTGITVKMPKSHGSGVFTDAIPGRQSAKHGTIRTTSQRMCLQVVPRLCENIGSLYSRAEFNHRKDNKQDLNRPPEILEDRNIVRLPSTDAGTCHRP